jgi:ankyrin repeat protein
MQKSTSINSSAELQDNQPGNMVAELLADASAGDVEGARALFEKGADLNAQDSFGNNALIYAAAGGHLALARWLVENGAQTNVRNQIGVTALRRAMTQGHKEMVSLLKKYGAEEERQTISQGTSTTYAPGSLLQAAREGNLDRLKQSLARGADVNSRNTEGWTPLMIAVHLGHQEIIRALLEHEPSQVNARNHHGWTPLRFAVEMGDAETLKMLLASGAEANAPDHEGTTALMQAAGEGNLECLEILLAAGADYRARNKMGETASHIAARQGFERVAKRLALLEP